MALPGLRDLYDRFEKVATPLAAQVVRTEEFAQVAAVVAGANKMVRAEAQKLQAKVWHAMNLPAGTDVQRLRTQLGALDREVRLLTVELEKSRQKAKGVTRRGSSGNDDDRPDPA